MCKYYAHMAERFNTSDDARRLGQRLRNARENKGLTLLNVADNVHVDHSQISRIERGQMITLGTNVQKLCKFLGVIPSVGAPGPAYSDLGARIDALVAALPASESAIVRFIDAMEALVDVPK